MDRNRVLNLLGLVVVVGLLLYFVLYVGFRHGYY
jgi:hypothetical protein